MFTHLSTTNHLRTISTTDIYLLNSYKSIGKIFADKCLFQKSNAVTFKTRRFLFFQHVSELSIFEKFSNALLISPHPEIPVFSEDHRKTPKMTVQHRKRDKKRAGEKYFCG
jgi:hypothetical protein